MWLLIMMQKKMQPSAPAICTLSARPAIVPGSRPTLADVPPVLGRFERMREAMAMLIVVFWRLLPLAFGFGDQVWRAM